MTTVLLTAALVLGASASPEVEPNGVELASTVEARSASLLGGLSLDATYRPSQSPALRIGDGVRFGLEGAPALDQGGGVSSEIRQILALILGFVPGFGLGHLIARDRDGFILFLVIDIVLYVVWGAVWGGLRWGLGWLGGIVWLVVHIIQALDAYAEAGGERIVGVLREKAVEIATADERRVPAITTTRAFAFRF
jgi:hypothetical protein